MPLINVINAYKTDHKIEDTEFCEQVLVLADGRAVLGHPEVGHTLYRSEYQALAKCDGIPGKSASLLRFWQGGFVVDEALESTLAPETPLPRETRHHPEKNRRIAYVRKEGGEYFIGDILEGFEAALPQDAKTNAAWEANDWYFWEQQYMFAVRRGSKHGRLIDLRQPAVESSEGK